MVRHRDRAHAFHDVLGIRADQRDHLQLAAPLTMDSDVGNRSVVAVSLEGIDAVPLGLLKRRADIVRRAPFPHVLVERARSMGIPVERIGAEDQAADLVLAEPSSRDALRFRRRSGF